MPLGIISPDDLEAELNKLNGSIPSRATVVDIKHGRNKGDNNVPSALQKIISEESISGAPAKQLSEIFGISPSSISAYKVGASSTASYNSPNESLANHVNDVKEQITSSARMKLMDALSNITSDKLAEAKVRDVAGIAKDMSSVIRNLEPEKTSESNGVQFVFYTPVIKQSVDYPIIDVSSE